MATTGQTTHDNASQATEQPGDFARQIKELQDITSKLIDDREALQDALTERDDRISAIESATKETLAEAEDRLSKLENASGGGADLAPAFLETDKLRAFCEHVRDNGFRNAPLEPKADRTEEHSELLPNENIGN